MIYVKKWNWKYRYQLQDSNLGRPSGPSARPAGQPRLSGFFRGGRGARGIRVLKGASGNAMLPTWFSPGDMRRGNVVFGVWAFPRCAEGRSENGVRTCGAERAVADGGAALLKSLIF